MKNGIVLTNVQCKMYSYREDIRWVPRDLSSILSLLLAYFETIGKSFYIILHHFLPLNNDNFHEVLWKHILPYSIDVYC